MLFRAGLMTLTVGLVVLGFVETREGTVGLGRVAAGCQLGGFPAVRHQ